MKKEEKKNCCNNEGNERKLYDEKKNITKYLHRWFLYISSRKGGLDRLF